MALRRRAQWNAAARRTLDRWENHGQRHLLRDPVVDRGYITSLTQRDPSGELVVVMGASHPRSFATGTAPSPARRASSETGSRPRSGAGTSRADSSMNGLLVVNGPCHQRSQRRVVRAGTPVARTEALTAIIVMAIALATTTTAPTYTRRPRKRTEGGMARRRHPSRPQQRLKRRSNASAAAASSPPRGLRGWSLRYSGPPQSRHGSWAARSTIASSTALSPSKNSIPIANGSNIASSLSRNSEASPSEGL